MACCCSNNKKQTETPHSCCGGKAPQTFAPKNKALPVKWRFLISLAALIASFLIAKSEAAFPGFPWSDPAWIAVLLCGAPIVRNAFNGLFRLKKITVPLLISIGIAACIALQIFMLFGNHAAHGHGSYIFAAGEVAFLMALGEMLKARTVRKTREGIEALVKISPKHAMRRMSDGATESVPVEQLRVGDCVLVRANEMIPADGEIIEGSGAVNQAELTGESLPVDKVCGDSVFAGTWNLSGTLLVRVTKPTGDTAIARLIRLVEEAEKKKAPIQHVADRWAAKVVPTAIASSLLVFALAFFFLGAGVTSALIRAVTILVVFCPCAFALATPTAIAAGIGNATRHGVLIKSGAALEQLATIDTVVFDKTGTLTRAALKIESVCSAGTLSGTAILTLCAAAEKHSNHPIAKAVVGACPDAILPPVQNLHAQNGIGLSCEIDGKRLRIRSRRALESENIELPEVLKNFASAQIAHGSTLVFVVLENRAEGIIALSDTLRENVPETLQILKRRGFRTLMLTGDNRDAGEQIAALAGVDDVLAELLPEDKARAIEQLRERDKRRVLMVGDGVNDAPAFAVADASVAMGALGSELAVETADIALLNDKIERLPALLRFSGTVLRTIHMNFALSITINLCSIVLSALGVLDPVSGAIVHNVSSVLVVMNSASLLTRKF